MDHVIMIKQESEMKYRIEYTKKGIPGYLYKYANSARELLVVLTDLNSEWIDFETIIVHKN